jgi:predicted kinase
MLIGLPASGKSTYAITLAKKENALIYSSDNLRMELYNDINNQDNNAEIFKILHSRIKEALRLGKNVIFDATNLNYKKRKAFLDELKKINCVKDCYLIATPYEKCVEQNSKRDRKVPEHVIKRMYKNIFIPQYYEGWTTIHIIKNFNEDVFDINDLFNNKLNGLNIISQDNPHHTLTIGKHCLKCMHNIENICDNVELSMAGLFHDIGKLFTKEFKNTKGEDTEIAHYYNHMNVSAYLSLFYLNFNDETNLKIIKYIQWHMQPFFIDSEKAKNKFIRLVGEDCYNKLLILHEADKTAK